MEPPNGSFASPIADAQYVVPPGHGSSGLLSYLYGGMGGWTAALTIILLLVAYDQCEFATLLGRGLNLHTDVVTVQYIFKKNGIAGPAWKFPFMGPFLQSMHPKFEEYKWKWASGELSCVSIFHKYVWCFNL